MIVLDLETTSWIRILHSIRAPNQINENSSGKGQLISKCLFGVYNSPQKMNLTSQIFALAYWGQKFFVRFLGELKKPKFSFQINWPLEGKQASMQIHQSGTLRRTCSMACKLLLFFSPLTCFFNKVSNVWKSDSFISCFCQFVFWSWLGRHFIQIHQSGSGLCMRKNSLISWKLFLSFFNGRWRFSYKMLSLRVWISLKSRILFDNRQQVKLSYLGKFWKPKIPWIKNHLYLSM